MTDSNPRWQKDHIEVDQERAIEELGEVNLTIPFVMILCVHQLFTHNSEVS